MSGLMVHYVVGAGLYTIQTENIPYMNILPEK